MIPLVDHPRDPQHRPWTTFAWMAVNALVALVTLPLAAVPWQPPAPLPWLPPEAPLVLDRYVWVVHVFAFRPAEPSLVTSTTAMFLHSGVAHLAGNLLYLWVYGPNVERRLGRLPFALLYLTAGLLGNLLYALASLGSQTPELGASGAISGVLGAYLVLFPLNTVRVWVGVMTLRVPAFFLLFLFVVVDNLLPFVLGSASSVAHAAHLGGFFAGMVLAGGLRLVGGAERSGRPRADPLARPERLLREGMVLDAHRALVDLAGHADPAVAAAARERVARVEADPAYQRAVHRGGA